MELPSCTIALTFFESPEPVFSYYATSSLPGWTVQPDGVIFPPSRQRRVQIHLTSFPAGGSFAGFQAAGSLEHIPAIGPWASEAELNDLGITVPTGVLWPPIQGTTILDLDFRNATTPVVFYRLAVMGVDGMVHWDDPKIYNDPAE